MGNKERERREKVTFHLFVRKKIGRKRREKERKRKGKKREREKGRASERVRERWNRGRRKGEELP